MNTDELKKAVWLLGQLFPNQLTEQLARYARDEFKAFDRADVEKAIKEHRGAHEFINWPNLLEGCRAAARARDKGSENARREGSWCDVYRRQCPALAERSDFEVVLRIHRGWWVKCSKSDNYRRQIEHSCLSQLIVAGMKPEDAPGWAATVFEESVEYFRQCLDELREAAAAVPQEAACA